MEKFLLVFLCFVCALGTVHSSGLKAILTYSGSYELHVNDKPWFVSQVPFVEVDGLFYSINNTWYWRGRMPDMDRLLMPKSQEPVTGADVLGNYKGFHYVYFAGDTRMDLSIRAYDNAVVFTQEFPNGLRSRFFNDQRPILSGFPAFQWDIVFQSYQPDGFLTFNGDLTDIGDIIMDRWDPLNGHILPSRQEAGPLCLFNMSSSDAVIISPLTNVMHVTPWHRRWQLPTIVTDGQSYWGIDRDLTSLPPGFKVEVILVYSPDGVGKAFERWGEMHRLYNKPATDTETDIPQSKSATPSSLALDTLGYWSGQGSYYQGNTTVNQTYEDILLNVERSARNRSVPLRYVEMDKWWYESANDTKQPVVTCDGNNQSLPSGVRDFEDKLGLPLVAVLGPWSSETTYSTQNNGSYVFHNEAAYALPMELRFWTDLFRNASDNNITHVILNDMEWQYISISALQSRAGMASDWLKNVSTAAYNAGITLTFSQVHPRMLMEAWKYPAVIQARVSTPYFKQVSAVQWYIGVISLLPKALGLAPFKGTFWSHAIEDGNPYGGFGVEGSPVTQSLVATLSTGSVVLGDKDDLLGTPDSQRCCRSDGVVLKPSVPATAIDSQIIGTAKVNGTWNLLGQYWSAVTSIDVINGGKVTSSYVIGTIMVAEQRDKFSVSPSKFFPGVFDKNIEVRPLTWHSGVPKYWQPLSDAHPLTFAPSQCNIAVEPAKPCLIHLIPPLLLNNGQEMVYLAGEDKFVPLSPQRVKAIDITHGLTLTLTGQPQELLTIFYYVNDAQRLADVTIGEGGTVDVALNITSSPMTTTAAAQTTEFETTTNARGDAVMKEPVLMMMVFAIIVALKMHLSV